MFVHNDHFAKYLIFINIKQNLTNLWSQDTADKTDSREKKKQTNEFTSVSFHTSTSNISLQTELKLHTLITVTFLSDLLICSSCLRAFALLYLLPRPGFSFCTTFSLASFAFFRSRFSSFFCLRALFLSVDDLSSAAFRSPFFFSWKKKKPSIKKIYCLSNSTDKSNFNWGTYSQVWWTVNSCVYVCHV